MTARHCVPSRSSTSNANGPSVARRHTDNLISGVNRTGATDPRHSFHSVKMIKQLHGNGVVLSRSKRFREASTSARSIESVSVPIRLSHKFSISAQGRGTRPNSCCGPIGKRRFTVHHPQIKAGGQLMQLRIGSGRCVWRIKITICSHSGDDATRSHPEHIRCNEVILRTASVSSRLPD